jgi:hypothetical protein
LAQCVEGVTRVLGAAVWRNAVLGFTRASESSAPPGVDFQQHVQQRADALRSAIARAGGGGGSELAVALIENSSRCPTNDEGERVVPGEVPWVVDLVEKVGGRLLGGGALPAGRWAAQGCNTLRLSNHDRARPLFP